MKKRIAFILVMVMTVTLLLPLQALAAYDQELTRAIGTAKSLLNISDDFDNFSYNIRNQNDKTIFDLNWNDRKNLLGNVSVSVDTTGRIISYYAYRPTDYRQQKKLPVVSKSDARKTADNFVQKINPAIWDKLEYWPVNSVQHVGDTHYSFRYVRIEKGISFPENNVNVTVNGSTGQVENFHANWYDDVVFPDTSGVIALEKAQQQFENKLGLKLQYRLSFSDQAAKPYLVYQNVYSNSFIDAKTGEVIRNDYNWGYYAEESKSMRAKGGDGNAQVENRTLSPKELEAVQNAASIIDESMAEETARSIFNIDSVYKLNWVNLYTDWRDQDSYIWNLEFGYEEKSGTNYLYNKIGVAIDAKDGGVISFNKSIPYDPNAQVKYNENQALKIAEDFIKSLQPEKFREVERTPWTEPGITPMLMGGEPRVSNFIYTRKVNGAYFNDNGFNITVDNVTGIVTGYNFNWFNKPLPGTEKIIFLDQAYKILYDSVGVQLQYISENQYLQSRYIAPQGSGEKPVIRLVYGIKSEKAANIDALTGSLLDYNGSPVREDNVTLYTDIKGSYAEKQIKVLNEYGVTLPGKLLYPSQNITQRDFLYLLQKAANPYYEIKLTGDSKDDEDILNSLTQIGILKNEEWAPQSLITRQEAVKFIIRALNYEKIAEINKEIYKLPFKDGNQIKPGLVGYIAIAYGLGIIHGDQGKFNPVAKLTRADAFILLYNYLNV